MDCLLPTAILVLSLGVLSVSAGTCPDAPTEAIQNCASQLKIDLNMGNGHMFVTNADYTDKMCDGDGFDKAVKCMEVIYNDCTSSGVIDHDMLAKPASWRLAFKEICDNRKFLKDNSACVEKDRTKMQTCVEKFQKKAEADQSLKNIGSATKGQKNQREIFKIICGLTDNLITCFDETLVKNCPKKMETILDKVLHKFLPPICHPADPNASYDTVNADGGKNSADRLSGVATLTVAVVMCLRSMF